MRDWLVVGKIKPPKRDWLRVGKLKPPREWSKKAEARAKGGRARAASLSQERRSEIARAAAQARWSKT